MMRVIKFRAWDKVNKEMIPWKGMYGICRSHDDYKDGGNVAVHLAIAHHCYLMPNYCEVMQFTGLLDRDGVEIYEGDIIISSRRRIIPQGVVLLMQNEYDKLPLALMTVEFSIDGTCGFEPFMSMSDGGIPDDIKIIGNIYENPDLMEVKG
jgi:uncharacterized phage protein (TIGR01671 family)